MQQRAWYGPSSSWISAPPSIHHRYVTPGMYWMWMPACAHLSFLNVLHMNAVWYTNAYIYSALSTLQSSRFRSAHRVSLIVYLLSCPFCLNMHAVEEYLYSLGCVLSASEFGSKQNWLKLDDAQRVVSLLRCLDLIQSVLKGKGKIFKLVHAVQRL